MIMVHDYNDVIFDHGGIHSGRKRSLFAQDKMLPIWRQMMMMNDDDDDYDDGFLNHGGKHSGRRRSLFAQGKMFDKRKNSLSCEWG